MPDRNLDGFFWTPFTGNPTPELIKPEEAKTTGELLGFQQIPPQQENTNFPTGFTWDCCKK